MCEFKSLSDCTSETGPGKLELLSWLKLLYFESHGTRILFRSSFTSVSCCLFLHLYLQLHRSADIMRTWVPNEMKWGKTRLLSASFSGQLLKTAGAASLTGPLTQKEAFKVLLWQSKQSNRMVMCSWVWCRFDGTGRSTTWLSADGIRQRWESEEFCIRENWVTGLYCTIFTFVGMQQWNKLFHHHWFH